jgi:hypothetical protein
VETTTKGGRAGAVPLVAEVAQVLACLGQRGYATGRDDPVTPGDLAGTTMRYLHHKSQENEAELLADAANAENGGSSPRDFLSSAVLARNRGRLPHGSRPRELWVSR